MDTRREPSFDAEPRAVHTAVRRRRRSASFVVVPLLAMAFVAAGWFWLSRPGLAPEVIPASSLPPPTDEASQVPQRPTSTPLPAPDKELVQAGGIPEALVALFGSEAVLRFLATTDFLAGRWPASTAWAAYAPVAAWSVFRRPATFCGSRRRIAIHLGRELAALRTLRRLRRCNGCGPGRGSLSPHVPPAATGLPRLGFSGRSLNDRVLK